jgi:hypothetical protein
LPPPLPGKTFGHGFFENSKHLGLNFFKNENNDDNASTMSFKAF